jgi:dipeptidase E
LPTQIGFVLSTRSSELERFVLEQDVIYVSGGNAVNMLALWRAHGLDRVLRTAW